MPHPPTFTHFTYITTTLATHHALQLDNHHRQLEEVRKRLAKDMDELEQRTNHFINNYWADVRLSYYMPITPYGTGWGHRGWNWMQYFRKLARDMHRPFIYVHSGGRYIRSTNTYETKVLLVIPRRKYLLPLYASFLLLDQTKHNHDTVNWRWTLEPEMFDWWCEQLRTNSEMQNAVTHSTRNHR